MEPRGIVDERQRQREFRVLHDNLMVYQPAGKRPVANGSSQVVPQSLGPAAVRCGRAALSNPVNDPVLPVDFEHAQLSGGRRLDHMIGQYICAASERAVFCTLWLYSMPIPSCS